MSSDNRHKREEPRRSQPNRDFSKLFRQSTDDSVDSGKSGANSGAAWADNVTRGVDLGYRVIEDQIRQGQRIAEQINNGSYGVGSMNNDMQDLTKSIQHYLQDTAQLYINILDSLSSGFPNMNASGGQESADINTGFGPVMDTFANALAGMGIPGVSGGNGKSSEHVESNNDVTNGKIVVVMASRRPLEVSIDYRSANGDLRVDHLHESDMEKKPLSEVSFSRDAENQVILRVTVADDHPSGLYNGVIYDSVTRKPCGTISVSVPDQDA